MRRLLVVLLCLAAFSPAVFASGLVGFGVQATGANVNFPDPLKEVYGQGFGGGAHLDINFIPFVGIRVVGDYISFSPDNNKYRALFVKLAAGDGFTSIPADWGLDGGRVGILSFSANAKFGLPTPVLSPYLTAGVGSASLSVSDLKVTFQGGAVGNVPGVKSETKFSANAGGGVELNFGVSLYLEAKYTWIFTEGSTDTYIPVSLGITF